MANYYCFMAGLPTVKLTDAQPQQSLLQLKEELADVLEPQDARLMQRYFMRFDCENLATLLADEAAEIDQRGNYDREALSLLIEEARQTDMLRSTR